MLISHRFHHASQKCYPYNGIQLAVKQLLPNLTSTTILTGVDKKEVLFIVRIPLIEVISILNEAYLCHDHQQDKKQSFNICLWLDFALFFPMDLQITSYWHTMCEAQMLSTQKHYQVKGLHHLFCFVHLNIFFNNNCFFIFK